MSIALTNLSREDLIDIWLYGEMNWGAESVDQYLDSIDAFLKTLINRRNIADFHYIKDIKER
ncbi:hypothetical protein CXF95_11345 [Paraglaciecola sp. MB-3u-78]|nr:hypothetical protein CXF95_11345 [Paraglaciecola sp. MB-3u-78]